MIGLTEFKKVALDAVGKAEKRILYYFKNQPKIETKIDSLVDEVHDVGTESARVGGMVQSEQMRQRR